jgi:threonine/homoserine/homoserine lactone efflux protein
LDSLSATHVAYCLMGIAVMISQSILLFNVIKWAGTAYLIYIGIKSLRARKPPGRVEPC